jgi:coproporphyrinogen III oxidase
VKKDEAVGFLKQLRDKIILAFEQIEGGEKFQRSTWNYDKGRGGGEMSVLRGKVFEKAAVNWSGVEGDKFPMDDASGAFFATGISLITHMKNPKAPTAHMNIRYIETEREGKKVSWIGGGYDLTPMGFPNDEDTKHFHHTAKDCLDTLSPELYPRFSLLAREYFYIPHRKRERGVGGIFFDHYNSGNADLDCEMWKKVGDSFLPAYLPILQRRVSEPHHESDRAKQLQYRAHYAEFNLLYDRGTKFGFQSGGNAEAILCSMPPLCGW